MSMGFHPRTLEPKHLVALSEGDVVEILEAFALATKQDPEHPYVEGERGRVLHRMLERLPHLFEDEGFPSPDTLSERGKQAIGRMVAGTKIFGVHIDEEVEGAQALRDALKESELANAYFDISMLEGKPGEERSAIVERRRAAEEALTDAALAYGLARMRREKG